MCIFGDDGTFDIIPRELALEDGSLPERERTTPAPVGYRSFRVETDGSGGLVAFHSPQQSASWEAVPVGDGSGRYIIDGTGRHLPTCRHTGAREGRTAGFYVVDDPSSDAIVSGPGLPGLAVFRVRPFGAVVRHEQPGGYRAESLVVEGIAYPVLPDDVAAELADLPDDTRASLMAGMGRRVARTRPSGDALALFEAFPAPLPADVVREGIKHRLSSIVRGYNRPAPVYIVATEDVRDSCRILSDVPHRHPGARDRGRVFTDKVARHIGQPDGTGMEWTTAEAREATIAEWTALGRALAAADPAYRAYGDPGRDYPLPVAYTVDPATLERLARETRREVGAESRRLHAAGDRRVGGVMRRDLPLSCDAEGLLRRVEFTPGHGTYVLDVWEHGVRSDGRTLLGYRFTLGGDPLFEGVDFSPGASMAIDSDEAIGGLLGFLTLGEHDTDEEYFEGYTAAQLAWRDESPDRELLAWQAMVMVGDADPTVYAEARRIGEGHGRNAAEWWCQDTIGGRSGRSTAEDVETARRVLRMLDDCDPELEIPRPDLSGEWADTYTALQLLRDVIGADETGEEFDDLPGLCDEYEDGFYEACQSEIARQCQLLLGDGWEA